MTRPSLKHVSAEMQALCFLLGEEILRWPGVTVRPMFGMRGFYRGDKVFAMLPGKRALRDANAFAYKLAAGEEKGGGEKWKFFPFTDAAQINAALAILDQAYKDQAYRKAATRR